MKEKIIRAVLTGGPCCGKTTILDELSRRGFSTLSEVAREVIGEGNFNLDRGYDFLQSEILKRQLDRESLLSEGQHFLDRGSLDGIAYSNLYLSKLPSCFQGINFHKVYNFIFMPDRLPLQKDGIRVESDDLEAEKIHQEIGRVYSSYGHIPIKVPLFEGSVSESVKKRADFILNYIALSGGKINGMH